MSEQQQHTEGACPSCAGLRAELIRLRILAGSESDWAAFYRSKLAAMEAERQALTETIADSVLAVGRKRASGEVLILDRLNLESAILAALSASPPRRSRPPKGVTGK